MFTQLLTSMYVNLKKTFVGSLVFTIAVFFGFADHSTEDPYHAGSIIKTANAADTSGGGGGGCGSSGCGCGGCGSGSGGGCGSQG